MPTNLTDDQKAEFLYSAIRHAKRTRRRSTRKPARRARRYTGRTLNTRALSKGKGGNGMKLHGQGIASSIASPYIDDYDEIP
eukprot:6700191-Pyramimonas_sp.AAC.1